MTVQIGVVIRDRLAAIVTVDWQPDDAVVTGIESLPFDIEVVAARVAELVDASDDSVFVIDAEGLGNALWAIVAPGPTRTEFGTVARDPRWRLYSEHGIERQKLVDGLVVAIHDRTLHFAPSLEGQEAMTTALLGYRRQVREDGLIGSELVVALCLAISRPPPKLGGWAFTASM